MLERIVVPIDGSEASLGALGPATALAARDGAVVELVAIVLGSVATAVGRSSPCPVLVARPQLDGPTG